MNNPNEKNVKTDGTSENFGGITSENADTGYLKFTKIYRGEYEVKIKYEYREVEIKDEYRSIIKSVTVPPKYNGLPVTELAFRAFYQCTNLEKISLPSSIIKVGAYSFEETSITDITIPTGVTSIENGTFCECTKLSNVVLPDTIKSIGSDAFSYCSFLKNIVLPEGMEVLGERAFKDAGLESIELPDNISVVPSYCFQGCKFLKSAKLPSKLIRIDNCSFVSCTSLTNITLPNSIQEIGKYAFSLCISLENLTIPKNVKKLGMLFAGNKNVKLIFEDTSGWQKRYVDSSNNFFGDWENIDPAVMADSDSFKNLMNTIYTDSDGNEYYYEFQKV